MLPPEVGQLPVDQEDALLDVTPPVAVNHATAPADGSRGSPTARRARGRGARRPGSPADTRAGPVRSLRAFQSVSRPNRTTSIRPTASDRKRGSPRNPERH